MNVIIKIIDEEILKEIKIKINKIEEEIGRKKRKEGKEGNNEDIIEKD